MWNMDFRKRKLPLHYLVKRFKVVKIWDITLKNRADLLQDFIVLAFGSVSNRLNSCYNVLIQLQVSLNKADEGALQTSATGAFSSLKLFHSVAALKNLNQNGKSCVFLLCILHRRMGLRSSIFCWVLLNRILCWLLNSVISVIC